MSQSFQLQPYTHLTCTHSPRHVWILRSNPTLPIATQWQASTDSNHITSNTKSLLDMYSYSSLLFISPLVNVAKFYSILLTHKLLKLCLSTKPTHTAASYSVPQCQAHRGPSSLRTWWLLFTPRLQLPHASRCWSMQSIIALACPQLSQSS